MSTKPVTRNPEPACAAVSAPVGQASLPAASAVGTIQKQRAGTPAPLRELFRPAPLRGFFRVLRDVGDAVLPQRCTACELLIPSRIGRLCTACSDEIRDLLAVPYCSRCGRSVHTASQHGDGCPLCASEPYWNVASLVRVGPYTGALSELAVGLKFGGRTRNAALLAELLAARLRAAPWFEEVRAFVPVPMHWLRRLQRPCNHAYELTEALAHLTSRPLVRAMRSIAYRPSQMHLPTRNQRFENVKGVFGPRRRAADKIAGRTVCIVDNLLMTGATIHEVSKVLRRMGAKRIYAAVIARTVTPGDMQAAAEAFKGHEAPQISP